MHRTIFAAVGMEKKEHIAQLVSSRLPSLYGEFEIVAFDSGIPEMPHLLLSNLGEHLPETVNVRIHSECMTGDVFGSTRCDCGEQLQGSFRYLEEHGGMLIYLRQEGRGIGLVNKLRAYNLQDEGMDTIDANLALGFQPDSRIFTPAIDMLRSKGVKKINLLTNNPEKVGAFTGSGIDVIARIPIVIPSRPENEEYLSAKRDRMGHHLHQ